MSFEQILYTKLLRINLCLHSAWWWFMEALLMSCSRLALWLKRLTEINVVLCNRFSRKNMFCLCWIIETAEWRKKLVWEGQLFQYTVGYFLPKKYIFAEAILLAVRQIPIQSLKPLQADDSPFCPACPLNHVPAERQPDVYRGQGSMQGQN